MADRATTTHRPVDLGERFGQFDDPWSPHLVARLNDYDIKLVRLEGEFVWHTHEETDELFLVLDGTLVIQLRDGDVTLTAGQLFVVPRGVEHCPRTTNGQARAMLIEPAGTLNTGDRNNERTAVLDTTLLD